MGENFVVKMNEKNISLKVNPTEELDLIEAQELFRELHDLFQKHHCEIEWDTAELTGLIGKPRLVKPVTLVCKSLASQSSYDFWVDADHSVSADLFRAAVKSYLHTPYGRTASRLFEENFHWDTAMLCVPPKDWGQHGLYPVSSTQTVERMGFLPVKDALQMVVEVALEENLLKD